MPDDRRLAYALAAFNGLRRNEAARLKWKSLALAAVIPFLAVRRKQGQTDEPDYIPVHPYVAKLLAGRLAMPAATVLPNVPDVATLEKEWTKAGVAFADEKGRRLDYHALRHTFQTTLDRTGCSRATKKKLMRHANEDVTDGYAHAELSEMLEAILRVPSPMEWQTLTAAATGTDPADITILRVGGPNMDQAATLERQRAATTQTADGLILTPCPETQPAYDARLGNERSHRREKRRYFR